MLKALAAGLISYVPGAVRFVNPRAKAPQSARYCYSVWLRHLVKAAPHLDATVPPVVAELGPGASLGVGLAALISGAETYLALDVVEHASSERNLSVFDKLVELFRARREIPGPTEFPEIVPPLEDYRFPATQLTDAHLARALAPERLDRIRRSIVEPGMDGRHLRYEAPWFDAAVIRPATADMIVSQAVLEHVDDLEGAYDALFQWLRPGGFMSHTIDYRCHGLDRRRWNAHWTYPDWFWAVLRGRRTYFLNRAPHSAHLANLARCGFAIVRDERIERESGIQRAELTREFVDLTDKDLCTSLSFVQARRPRCT